MKKAIPFVVWALMLACSCSKILPDTQAQTGEGIAVSHGEIVLGGRLDNPYSVSNMKSAYESVYPGRASSDVSCTDLYIRFLPKDDAELERFRASGLPIIDHPMDYEIVREGDYYHDPSLSSDAITWQYAVVPVDYEFPKELRYEVIQQCFLVDNRPSTKADPNTDWDMVEEAAYRLSGNAGMYDRALTKAGDVNPSGRISIVDEKYNAGQCIGVSGVKVQCNVFVKFSSAYTDRDGYYRIPKKFTSSPRYRLVFENEKGFSIGFNSILYKGSISTLGKNSVSGVDITVTNESDRALFRRSVANNAAYEYYERCEQMGIATPPSGMVMWMFEKTDASSTVMLHHDTVLDKGAANVYFKAFSWIIQLFGPDVTIGVKDAFTFSDIYSKVVHELAHASHFSKVGVTYWNRFINYILSSSIRGAGTYGDGSEADSGYCAVGEIWAYYMESRMYADRYSCSNPLRGSNLWFHPQMFSYLESRGITTAQLFDAVASEEVTDMAGLRDRLIELYPSKKNSITQVFNRYE